MVNFDANENVFNLDFYSIFSFGLTGVLWMYNNVINGSPEVINRFKEMGKKVFFVTNNSTKTRTEFLEKSNLLNFRMVEVCDSSKNIFVMMTTDVFYSKK